MKKNYLIFLFFIVSFISNAQNPFIITVDTNLGNNTINLNTTYPQGYNFNYTIDLGDGTVLNNLTESLQYTYSSSGVYTISISGVFPFFNLGNNGIVVSIDQWGDIIWKDMSYAFADCDNMVLNAIDAPDLSQVTSLKGMFSLCDNFNQSINHWDVSNITDMFSMFSACPIYNQPLDNWNVSNVTNMGWMFFGATAFNQPLDSWNVSNVSDMNKMFSTSAFNQPINNWDVSNVTDMSDLFQNSSLFNQPLNNWSVSNVTDMSFMFHNAIAFNQPINNWDTSSLESVYSMFKGAIAFNQPLDNWNTNSLEDIEETFSDATLFNQALDNWNFSNLIYANNFVDNSGLDVSNYDSLLESLTTSSLQGVQFNVNGLEYCNLASRDYLINSLGWNISGDSISSSCNFIVGSVYYDSNNDGCTSNDIGTNNLFFHINNGDFNASYITSDSVYSFPVVGNNFNITIDNIPDYFTASPQTATVDFLTSTTEQVDFCLTSNQTINDLNITLLPISDARPGFEAEYKLTIENIGTQPLNNITASLNFDDTKQSFISAIPAENSSSTNSLDFTIASLNPFETQEIDIVMQTFTPPTVNGDDVLNFTATVLPDANDYTPNDNTFNLEQIVVNAFDPNDKRVLQGNTIATDETGEYLDYIIRFQNTGTANATFVRIEDNLDTDLDWNTFKITSASHNYEAKITNGNEVEFLFDNINLPYEAIDAEGSNGFIAYKIKPKTTVQVGDIMSGNASIYFDYNLPIITNTVSTEVISNLSVDEFNLDNLLSVYPNPTNGGVFIKHKDNVFLNSVKLYNVQGTELISINKDIDYLDIKNIAAGLYILSIETNKGKVNEKLVVK